MAVKIETFEEFLMTEHAKSYKGTDDGMPDAFEEWLFDKKADELVEYAEMYTEYALGKFKSVIESGSKFVKDL